MGNNSKAVILIVDDAASNIQLLASILSDDYDLKVATNGKRGIEIANASPQPDLILLDIEMPEMNGYEVCRELKKNPLTNSVPVIFVTAKDEDSDEELGLELGAADYITKPVKPAIVKARVKTQITVKRQRDQLIKMALHDQLTDLYNRHYLMETANAKVSKSLRHKIPISAVVIDLDHFKSINDNYGHDKGDLVLRSVAEQFKLYTRKEDIAARLGGEEFVVIFDHCDLNRALSKAEELRSKIEECKPDGLLVTASMGVSELLLENDSLDQLLNRADKALYTAKQNGRNRVNAYE